MAGAFTKPFIVLVPITIKLRPRVIFVARELPLWLSSRKIRGVDRVADEPVSEGATGTPATSRLPPALIPVWVARGPPFRKPAFFPAVIRKIHDFAERFLIWPGVHSLICGHEGTLYPGKRGD